MNRLNAETVRAMSEAERNEKAAGSKNQEIYDNDPRYVFMT